MTGHDVQEIHNIFFNFRHHRYNINQYTILFRCCYQCLFVLFKIDSVDKIRVWEDMIKRVKTA